jgi:hypothetical protein
MMPLYLKPVDVSPALQGAASVLIVSCPVCPPISLAMQKGSPFIELFKSGLKTPAFENYINEIRAPLEQRGVRTDVYSMYTPCPTMCLWTKGQRGRLRKRAQDYDAVIVLGCDSADYTAQQALENTDCKVVVAMHRTGLTNATVKFHFPITITLENKTRVGEKNSVNKLVS